MSDAEGHGEPGPLLLPAMLATGVPVLPFTLIGLSAPDFAFLIFAVGFIIAALHVGILFLPAWLLLSGRTRMPWPATAALGLVCGGLPWLFLLPEVMWLFATCGLVGGLVFHAARACLRRTAV